MTHIYVMQGTVSGGPAPRTLTLDDTFENTNTFGDSHTLVYITADVLALDDRFTNVNTFHDLTLLAVDVTPLTNADAFANTNTFEDVTLFALPFEAECPETQALIDEFTGTYSTTEKIQLDTLICALIDAGIWLKLDWYWNAYWAKNEHDALLDWKNPTRSLEKIGAGLWTLNVGLSGVNPMINSGRFATHYDVGDGPNATNTNIAVFAKITAVASPQNGMLPLGCWVLSSPGPAQPIGTVLSLSITSNVGFALAYSGAGEGNTGFAVGDGTGVWVVSRNGSNQKTFKNGVELDSDTLTLTISGGEMHPDGICFVGSTGSSGTTRSFPGTLLYGGIASALNAAEAAALESAFQAAILPPSALDGALLTDSDSYLDVDGTGNYLKAV